MRDSTDHLIPSRNCVGFRAELQTRRYLDQGVEGERRRQGQLELGARRFALPENEGSDRVDGRSVSGMPRGSVGWRVVGAALASALALLAFGSSTALGAGACPNEALRTGRSAQLPDCRAYEQVSPVEKGGADVSPLNEAVAVDGGAITYPSAGGFAGASANSIINQYLSVRGADGWSTEGITIPFENSGGLGAPEYTAFSPDLSHAVIDSSLAVPTPEYFYRHNPDGTFTLLNPGMPPSTTQGSVRLYVGASDDFSQIYMKSYEQLTPDAPEGEFPYNEKIYRWDEGTLTLASVLPDGTPSIGTAGGTWPVSADGSRLYWHAAENQIEAPQYLTENGTSRLVTKHQSDGSEAGANFQIASRDGSIAYFTSAQGLTEDASTSGADLYRYDADEGKMVDVTPSSEASGAAVQGVLGASDDGSIVYFVAEGVLAPGATAGQLNLYVNDGLQTTFVTTLSSAPWLGASPWARSAEAQVSADGRSALFLSADQLIPGYENNGHTEAYLYEMGGGLTCVSCNPSGEPAQGDAKLTQTESINSVNVQENFPVDNIAAGGSEVFFETTDALLPTDTNDKRDVYEWERAGSGSCQGPSNCLYLISTGRDSSSSTYEGASRSGEDVFILTREALVGQDTDNNVDVYDARVDGGLASQNPPAAPPGCETSDACRGTASAATPASIGSAGFVGPANQKPQAKKKAKHRKHPRKHKRRHHKAKRRASARKAHAARTSSANEETK